MPPRTRWNGFLAVRPLAYALLLCAAFGVYALFPGFGKPEIWAVIAAVFLLSCVPYFGRGPRPLLWACSLIGVVGMPLFGLVGVDWAYARLGGDRLTALPSVIAGAALVWGAAAVYLAPWWTAPPSRFRAVWAADVAFLLILVPPVGVYVMGEIKGDERALDQARRVVSSLDAYVIAAGPLPAADEITQNGWRVRPFVAGFNGDRVTWGGGGRPGRTPVREADRVVLLMPDGAAPDPVEPPRETDADRAAWLDLAARSAPAGTPLFVVLRSEARRAAWNAALPRGRGKVVVIEPAVLEGGIAALALDLAVSSPRAREDLALMARHRPVLFFDSDEPYRTPLNIDRLLESGLLRLCGDGEAVSGFCSTIHSAADLHNGAPYLTFDDPEALAGITQDATVYARVTRSRRDHPSAIHIDYWWYFPHNPAEAGEGALCGAGFVIAGYTCFDHQSDWEGVTVVLDAARPQAPPTAVYYAQHDHAVRYSWDALQALWERESQREFAAQADVARQPLVFVAQGRHASYPVACAQRACNVPIIPGVRVRNTLTEKRHDGRFRWPAREEDCAAACVQALPTTADGEPARWNAYEGRWGDAECVLGGVFCSESAAPRSPAHQDRYETPWCAEREATFAAGRYRLANLPAECPPPADPVDTVVEGERLFALGDSYSSGQGAGSYERGTNRPGRNTCYRSRDAWPAELARRLGMRFAGSAACSGATIPEVTSDRPGRREPGRRPSQIGRITGDPGVVTISVGGNDVGFADVLEACFIAPDCTRRYAKPGGDLLEAEVARLGARLPAVYQQVRDAAPRARIVVMGYPRLFSESYARTVRLGCGPLAAYSPKEVAYLNARTRSLNATIATAAAAAGATFVDVTEAFAGRELRCPGEDSYMNRLRFQSSFFPASFHPTADGHDRLADVIAPQVSVETG